MANLVKSSTVLAIHQIPLECDIYDATDYPSTGPVFLFFHSNGLVGGHRSDIPPWLVQACYRRKWPLISPSYRVLPHVDGGGALLEDATAAYNFARKFGGSSPRDVIVGGASAGFFMAALTAHHMNPKPVALLSITGIPTFRHPFFNSSYLIPPSPLKEEEVEAMLAEPVSVGNSPHPAGTFYLERLLPTGAKNPAFQAPTAVSRFSPSQDPNRGILYDYFLYENAYLPMVDSVDPGFDWAGDASRAAELAAWPVTVFIHGNKDVDVPLEVCTDVAKALGSKGKVCLAPDQEHLFEMANFLEDETGGMDAVRQALVELDQAVAK